MPRSRPVAHFLLINIVVARACAAPSPSSAVLSLPVFGKACVRFAGLVTCGMAKVRAEETRVDVTLEMRSAAHPERESLREQCARTLRDGLPWAREITVALRTALLEPDAATQQLPVVDLDGLIDRALSDPSDIAHFFRVLADPHATFDKEVPGKPDGEERRHALAAYVSLELMRVQVEREHRHPLRDWMSRTLNAQGASSNTISVLTKLSIAAKEASSNIAYHEGDEFSSLRAQERERAFRDRLSLKLHDFDNIGFTKKGKKVGYEQFIASAWKE